MESLSQSTRLRADETQSREQPGSGKSRELRNTKQMQEVGGKEKEKSKGETNHSPGAKGRSLKK